MDIYQTRKDDVNDFHKITENYYCRRAACNADTARKMDYPRFAPGRADNLCRPQQSGQELADPVALFADFARSEERR